MARSEVPVWNVSVPAVALVRAETREDAIAVVVKALEAAGLEAYEDGRDAFESEVVVEEHLFERHVCPPRLSGPLF